MPYRRWQGLRPQAKLGLPHKAWKEYPLVYSYKSERGHWHKWQKVLPHFGTPSTLYLNENVCTYSKGCTFSEYLQMCLACSLVPYLSKPSRLNLNLLLKTVTNLLIISIWNMQLTLRRCKNSFFRQQPKSILKIIILSISNHIRNVLS